MNRTRPSLTEKTAAIAYARAINTHEIELLAPLVHDDLRIVDQRNWDHRVGGRHYLGMLEDYFECVPRDRSQTWMELATVPRPSDAAASRPCVVEYQSGRPVCTVLFHVEPEDPPASKNGSCRRRPSANSPGSTPASTSGPARR